MAARATVLGHAIGVPHRADSPSVHSYARDENRRRSTPGGGDFRGLPNRRVEGPPKRETRRVELIREKRMMGLEPTTFCMATP